MKKKYIEAQIDNYIEKGMNVGLDIEDYHAIKRLLGQTAEFCDDDVLEEIIIMKKILCLLYRNGIANRIPIETINYIKNKAPLLPLVLANDSGDYKVRLSYSDSLLMFLCPFHEDHKPSFSVKDMANFGHCFGCHKKVDSITYVQAVDTLKFTHAIELLASIYLIDIGHHSYKNHLIEKYQKSVLSDKYKELLDKVYNRLIKKGFSTTDIDNIYIERYSIIERIKKGMFDSEFKPINNSKQYILTKDDVGDIYNEKDKSK